MNKPDPKFGSVKIVSIENNGYFCGLNEPNKKKYFYMLIVKVSDGEKIERALKRFKRKTKNTKLLQEIRDRKQYTKKSAERREMVEKAVFKEKYLREQEKL